MASKRTLECGARYGMPDGTPMHAWGFIEGRLMGHRCAVCGNGIRTGAFFCTETDEQTGRKYLVGTTCVKKMVKTEVA